MPRKSGSKKRWKSIAIVTTGVLVGSTGVWIATHLFGEVLTKQHTENRALELHQQVVQSLDLGNRTFAVQGTRTADQEFLQRFVRSGTVSRISLFNHQGQVFWSSGPKSTLDRLEPELRRELLASKIPIVALGTSSTSMINRVMRWLPFPVDRAATTESDLTRVITRVVEDGQVVGAIEFSINTAGSADLINRKMNLAAMLIGLLLTTMFLLAGYMTGRAAHAKLDSTMAKALAREARKSEIEAREVADQLTERSEFVGQLNRLLEVNLKQLNEAQEALVRKSRLAQMGELTATVAHEIRNPLFALRNALFIVRQRSTDIDSIGRHLDIADRSVGRCDKFISELLDFTRVGQLNRQILNFDDWVSAIVENQTEHLPKSVGIKCTLTADAADASFDPDRMLRVLINMLSNASEAMVGNNDDPQDVVVDNPLINIITQQTSRGIELLVTDNGSGMDEEQLAKIFEPLYSTKTFGIGLGVPAMLQVLEQHGGGLEYQSKVGRGTTATAWFPLNSLVSEPELPESVPDKFAISKAAKLA